MFKGKDKGVE